MSFSVSSAKPSNPSALVPRAVVSGVSTVDYNVRQQIYISELMNSNLIRLVNIPAGTPSVALPTPAQLITLFQNPVVGSFRGLFMTNNAQVNITGTTPASQIVAHNSISLVTIRVQDPVTPIVNVQIFPVGAASVPAPIAIGLTVGASASLAANLVGPHLSSSLTEVTLQTANPGATVVMVDSSLYYQNFSGSPGLPFAYSFYINNDSGNQVTLTKSNLSITFSYVDGIVTDGSSNPLLPDGTVCEVTIHFSSDGTSAQVGVTRIA